MGIQSSDDKLGKFQLSYEKVRQNNIYMLSKVKS